MEMRDLEQIQEADPDARNRRLGAILIATLAVVGLTFAMGVVVGQAAEPADAEPGEDPLTKLDEAHGLAPAPQPAPEEEVQPVSADELTFPSALSDEQRPEVVAAVQAAAQEEASLRALSDKPDGATSTGNAPASGERIPATMPAAVAASAERQRLNRAAEHDPLVAAAMPDDDAQTLAKAGREGDYTIQVISYDRPEPAQAFAKSLRARGHEAFVVQADIPERGRYFRVRIGPFETKLRAQKYREEFEEQERMNTYVVRRDRN